MNQQIGKFKIFRDSIHGYISVPENYCNNFIDTPIFQRLRHIEQTSMRALYPSAHHDRFAHSLGTFYLGTLAFNNFRKNSSKKTYCNNKIKDISDEQWELWRHTFLIACLMHDCAHAPFSHTFEEHYDHAKKIDPTNTLINKLVKLTKLKAEISSLPTGSPHEKVSAIMILKQYQENIKNINRKIDPILIVRMITGWKHFKKRALNNKIENCLIGLLNGTAIDVDKLDYILRDTWASGINNTSIDVHRLMNSISLGEFNGRVVLAFEKSALSVLQSVVDARNYLYRWIYSHHKVFYDSWLLKKSVELLASNYTKNNEPDFIKKMFSIESLTRKVTIGDDVFYLPSDGDIISLIKKSAKKYNYSYEWISRIHSKKALWKSHAEYAMLFPDRYNEEPDKELRIFKQLPALIKSWENDNSIKVKPVIEELSFKVVIINPDTLYLNILDETHPYTSYSEKTGTTSKTINPFPYVFIDKDKMSFSKEIIKYIKENLT